MRFPSLRGMESADKTKKMVAAALIIAVIAVVIGAVAVVKAKDANDAANNAAVSSSGQQAALSSNVDARLTQLERNDQKALVAARREIRQRQAKETRQANKTAEADRKDTTAVAAEAQSIQSRTESDIALVKQQLNDSNAKISQLQAEVKKLQRQINNLP